MPAINDNNRKWWILAAMGTVLGVVTLDETVVGVALPTVIDDLNLTTVASHWVINAYLLVFTGLAAAAGRLGDIVGLRLLFVIGLAIFAIASLASGFAASGSWLIATPFRRASGAQPRLYRAAGGCAGFRSAPVGAVGDLHRFCDRTGGNDLR